MGLNGLAIATLRGLGCCRDERAQAEGRRRVDDVIPSSSLVPLPHLELLATHDRITGWARDAEKATSSSIVIVSSNIERDTSMSTPYLDLST